MRLPQELIDRIREATDIVAVVSENVQLKKSGRTWKALCPFHQEKTPSFTVNPDRQIFKCFGCGEGGDVFRFLMEVEKLSFREAAEVLAGAASIPLPQSGWSGPEEQSVYPALEWASSFYRRELAGKTGGPAREYLKKRGLGEKIIDRFGLGWAPPGWSNLLDAPGKNYPPGLLLRAGLVIQNDHGGHYDRFRERLMIPIRSPLGRTVGFGARTLGSGEPKYLNSPETEVFNKSRVLFGLSEGRQSLKDANEAWVVEGYMDVLALSQAGFDHVVASCGTAFTEDQARVLKRYVDRAVLIFDGDTAGLRAAWKSAAVFLGSGLEVRIVALPDGHDPDSFVGAKGAEALETVCREAPGVVGFAREALVDRLEKREDLIKAFAYLGSRVNDPIRRRVLLQDAAEQFRFDEETLVREAARLQGKERPVKAQPQAPETRDILGRLYMAGLLSEEIVHDDDVLPETVLREKRLREMLARWLSLRESGEANPRSRLLEDEPLRSLTAEILASDEEVAFEEVVARLTERVRAAKGKELKEAIREAESQGDTDQVERLLRELHSLKEAR
jgi:DNA primase